MFLLYAEKAKLTLRQYEPLTSGSVNVHEVRFEFSGDWNGLTRTAVFRAEDKSVSMPLDEDGECAIPWEVLEKPGIRLVAGVYGTWSGEIVLPSEWISLGPILEGVAVGEAAREPTLDVYEHMLEGLAEAQKSAAAAEGASKGAEDAAKDAQAAAQDARSAAKTAQDAAAEAVEMAQTAVQDAEQAKADAHTARGDAQAARNAIENMTVSAGTLPADSEATAVKTVAGGSFDIRFGIPRGEQGATGPEGKQGVQGPPGKNGINGIAVPSSGQYAFNVNDEGHLILSYTGNEAPDFSINSDGHLILNII